MRSVLLRLVVVAWLNMAFACNLPLVGTSGTSSTTSASTSGNPGAAGTPMVVLPGTILAQNRQVRLNWTSIPGDQTGFYIERSLDGVTFTQIQTVPDGTNTLLITGLTQGSTYHFRMRAYNATGTSAYTSPVAVAVP